MALIKAGNLELTELLEAIIVHRSAVKRCFNNGVSV